MHPEAIVQLNGTDVAIGGLTQTGTFLAYCNRSDLKLGLDPNAFRTLVGWEGCLGGGVVGLVDAVQQTHCQCRCPWRAFVSLPL